ALLLESTPSKELLEGGIQVPKGLLWGTFGDLIQPGIIRLLEGIELAVKINGVGAFLGRSIPLLLDLQSPIIRPPSRASMLAAGGDLPVVQVQLGFVRPLHQHL